MTARRVTRRYAAFLRAINVGGRTVRMEQLRSTFEDLGHANVSTFIASGNVIFESVESNERALTTRIEAGLLDALGFGVRTFLRPVGRLQQIVADSPFQTSDEGTTYVVFLHEPPDRESVSSVLALQSDSDRLSAAGRDIYWQCATGTRQSAISGAVIEKLVSAPATVRNINTVRRMAAKFGDRG